MIVGRRRKSVRLGIVENDALSLFALRALLCKEDSPFVVTWSVTTGKRAIELFTDPTIIPDALLLDVSLEDMPGTIVCKEIRRKSALFPILGITSFSLNTFANAMAVAGAQGLIGKTDVSKIVESLSLLLMGKTMTHNFPDKTVCFDSVEVAHRRLSLEVKNTTSLSSRERETVELCFKGYNLREVAEILNISVETVKTYLKRAERRTGTANKDQLLGIWRRWY